MISCSPRDSEESSSTPHFKSCNSSELNFHDSPTLASIHDSVQFSSVAQSCPTLCHPMNHSTPGLPAITNSGSFLKLMSIELVMPSRCLILCQPLPLLLPIPPTIRDFSNESTLCIRWPKYWSFSFSISPSNEHPGLIFRMDWLDLLAVQESSPTPQYKSVNFSALSFLHSSTLTSIHDHWKNYSLD